ncbi:MAG TPA: UvrD-helicase domain-containing protein [Solirubrobacterales bacterium]|nr:UvrD-helicase domain-containing protein [Solirubrobacterales bacterium]
MSEAATIGERTPTPEQAAAINLSGRDALLEAGAGAGKTGVMVDRYCRLVCEQHMEADAILAITFTDKAAAELRQRIRAELTRRAEQGEERARELLGEIGGAWVTTIHGFCNRLLARHPVAVGIDPRFRVLDAPETARAAHEAFDEALEELLEAGVEAHEELVATYGVEGLRAIVIDAYAELRSRGVADPRLPDPPAPDAAEATRHAIETIEATLAELKPDSTHRPFLERAAATLAGGGRELDLDELASLRVKSKAKDVTACREAIDDVVARSAEAGAGGDAYRGLGELLRLFSVRFAAAKQRRSGIDFEDLQLLAVGLLEKAEIGDAYRSQFKQLMVDEFQDTNLLQLRLIESLRGPGSELMVVGDEFQSIYGFRHADLDVFRAQRSAMDERPRAGVMELSGNFRSRPEVIGAVNELAGKMLGESFRPLRVGSSPEKQLDEPAVELLLTGRDGWDGKGIDLEPAVDSSTPLNCLAEARFVAERLRALVDEGYERSEMVVLLRAFSHLDAYEDSLERAGLRPYVVGGRGYWSQQQVADVCALLATIANPLDDEALFGALASPACGLTPDTLWLLRTAAGNDRHVWPAVERAAGLGEGELEEPQRLEQIGEPELALLHRFAETIAGLRERGTRISLAGLIEAVVSRTGYDLAVLMRAAGEARFANVRKLMRLAAEFESREGRDLRGLLDFIASQIDASAAEAQAATAVEGHDGVRIMTVHNAKGLEFEVVAVPDLARSLLAGARAPLLSLGRGEDSGVGMQFRRLGATSINLYSYVDLCEKEKERDAEEGLRLFYVAATRARERLILSGVVKSKPSREVTPATSVVERIVTGFDIDRESDSMLPVPAPLPREGLDRIFEPSEVAVRVSRPSPARAAELAVRLRDADRERAIGRGPAPLDRRRAPAVPRRPLSYSAISAYDECAYRFYMERVLGLGSGRGSAAGDGGAGSPNGGPDELDTALGDASPREERTAHGTAVHALLEWSEANEWREPDSDLARRHALAAGLNADSPPEELIAPVRGWLGSELCRTRVAPPGATVRAEAPILLGVGGTVVRGSIDLLVDRPGEPPLVVDYKTDRLDGSDPASHAAHYEIQRSIYALAVSEALGVPAVEVAYVFLERPDEPVISEFDAADLKAARARLTKAIEQIGAGEFPTAAPEERSWALCEGCPALGRLCAGPHRDQESSSEKSS